MPKLYIFVTCEKVIIAKDEQTSLISLFNVMNVMIPTDQTDPIASNAVVPKEWVIFTSWEREPQDDGKEYSQIIEILYPDGTHFAKPRDFKFTIPAGKSHYQCTTNVNGFPIGQLGMYTVKMRLERNAETISGPTSIKINLQHVPAPPVPA